MTIRTSAARLGRTWLVALTCLASTTAQAAFITFDEFPYKPLFPDEPSWSDHPITDEYASLGVVIDGGYLQPAGADPAFRDSQFLLGGPYLSIRFTGADLPTHVALAFRSPQPGFRATVGAMGADGSFLRSFDTGGDYFAGLDDGWVRDRPYTAYNLASFSSQSGVSGLFFDVAIGTRITAKIDNLYFGNVPAVPEPATLAMWAAGLGVVALARRRHGRQALPST